MKKSFAIISCIATGLTYANVEVNLKDESANQLKRIIACIDDSDTLYRIGIACERNKNVLNNDQNVATYAITRFFRGVCNVITSPLEIIRSPFVDSQSCIVTGSSNALCRFFNGVIEFSTFGIYESKIYGNEFPEYIWGSRWKPQVGLNDLALFSRFCIEKSALKGHGEAQSKLGDYIFNESNGNDNKRIEAIKWYERAVRNGATSAETKLRNTTGF